MELLYEINKRIGGDTSLSFSKTFVGSTYPTPKKSVVRRNNALKGKKKIVIGEEITLGKALKNGNTATRSSCLIMGLGNFLQSQVIKGLLFLLMEVSFILFMVGRGTRCLRDLITLGTKVTGKEFDEAKQIYIYIQGDNSMLCLLYGIVTIFVILFFVYRFYMSSKLVI